MIETIEQIRCPACDSLIPREAVKSEFREQWERAAMLRIVTATCDHCRRVWRGRFRLRNGVWDSDGEVIEVRGRDRRAALRRLDALRGDVAV